MTRTDSMNNETPTQVPHNVLLRARRKARLLYIELSELRGQSPGPVSECWAEFEALDDYL